MGLLDELYDFPVEGPDGAVGEFVIDDDALNEIKGGPGSGNFGHAGRPGMVGGSSPAEGGGAEAAVVEASERYTLPDTSKWVVNAQTDAVKKKIETIKEAAAKGDWGTVLKYMNPGHEYKQSYAKAVQKTAEVLYSQHMLNSANDTTPKELGSIDEVTANAADWNKLSGKMGTQEGGVYQSPTNNLKYYVKFPENPKATASEALANKLYEVAGAGVPKGFLVEANGKSGFATEYDESLQKVDWKSAEAKQIAAQDFAVHAWLGNWDCIGAGSENPMDNVRFKEGQPITVDVGGSLEFKGTMQPKASGSFGTSVSEWDTLRNQIVNPSAAAVFKDMTVEQLHLSAQKVAGITDEAIDKIVTQYAGKMGGSAIGLATVLKARRDDIIARDKAMMEKVNNPPAKPEEPKPPVQVTTPGGEKVESKPLGPMVLPPPPMFASKWAQASVNKMNKMHELAVQGKWDELEQVKVNLTTKNNYLQAEAKYKAQLMMAKNGGSVTTFSKPTTTSTTAKAKGPLVADESSFPSKPEFASSNAVQVAQNKAYIETAYGYAKKLDLAALQSMPKSLSEKASTYHNGLLNAVAEQLNPPPPPMKIGSSLQAISKQAKVVLTTAMAAGKSMVGKWIKLVQLSGMPEGMNANGQWSNPAGVGHWGKGKSAYDQLPSHIRTTVRDYTGGDYDSINGALRGGAPSTEALNAANGVTKASIPIIPGTMLSRKHSLSTGDIEKLKKSVGSVLQDKAVLSTSTDPKTWSGTVHWKLKAGDGVVGLPAKDFSKHPDEDEYLLPPNTRVLVTKVDVKTPGSTNNGSVIAYGVILPFEPGQCCPP